MGRDKVLNTALKNRFFLKSSCPMLFELLLNGMDRFLKLRDTEMEMV